MRFVLCLLLATAACASTAPEGPSVQTATVKSTVAPHETVDLTRELLVKQVRLETTRDRVWNAMLETHEALGIPFLAGDVAAGNATFELANRIRTVAGKPASRYIDCGIGPAGARADSYRLVIRISHLLENAGPNATILSTTMQAWARSPGVSSDPIPCSSKGVLETEIGGMMTTRLR